MGPTSSDELRQLKSLFVTWGVTMVEIGRHTYHERVYKPIL